MSDPAALLSWYRRARRDLPWRRTRDPWAIWVSEVMLQQTRVEHVVAYFERFLDRFPTPAALAAAPLEEALASWSGLGYYRRLRLLHRAAAEVMAHGGNVPAEPAALRALPGVGDYTAAAVASIAFGLAVPVLDGNVERVLCRYLACVDDPRRAPVRRRLREAAAALLAAEAPGESNQALMELGARICTPRAPRCEDCPLAPGCAGRQGGEPERFPRRPPRRPSRRVSLLVAVVEREGRVLLFRRDESEVLLAGTWELPWIESHAIESNVVEGHEVEGDGDWASRRLAARYGGVFQLGDTLGRVRHAITTRRLVATVRRASFAEAGVGGGREAAWVAPGELSAFPVSSLVRKALVVAG